MLRLTALEGPRKLARMPPISPELQRKDSALRSWLQEAGRVLVAFSGGVDSSYLAYAAHAALGDDALAVTALSPSYPATHREMAEQVISSFGIPHRFVETHEMGSADYRANRPDRCYHCKTELFRVLGGVREALDDTSVNKFQANSGQTPRKVVSCMSSTHKNQDYAFSKNTALIY